MKTANDLADFISGMAFDSLPAATVEHLKMHVLDTLGAMMVGARTAEGLVIDEFTRQIMSDGQISLLQSVITGCAATRSTEFDDIHIAACITPGSIIVPAALSLADKGYLTDGRHFLTAVAIGYDFIIRLGLAIDGPDVLSRGIWPTCLAAPLGCAALTAKALALNPQQAANALVTALALTGGIMIPGHGALSSRWLTAGTAAMNGVIAAFAAKEGFSAGDSFPGEDSGQLHGLTFDTGKLTGAMGEHFHIDETGMKPFPVARQAMAAVEAFRRILAEHGISPASIEKVTVKVPEQLVPIIDHPDLTGNRLEAISSVQYQIALAAANPEGLLDLRRDKIDNSAMVVSLMKKVGIEVSPELAAYYPSVWPARVEVKAAGKVYGHDVLNPRGDYRNRLNWEELAAKFGRAAADRDNQKITGLVRNLDDLGELADLIKLL